MDSRLKKKITGACRDFARIVYSIGIVRPKRTLSLILHPSTVKGTSYFPDKKSHSFVHIWFDQLINIWAKGDIDEFYYLYGLDVKPRKARKDYVVYCTFARYRDRLNLSDSHNTSCVLRDKLLFGMVAKGAGIAIPETLAYTTDGDEGYIMNCQIGKRQSLSEFVSTFEGEAFCKPLDGECGNGIFRLSISNGNVAIDKSPSDVSGLKKLIDGKQYIFQTPIKQHEDVSRIYPAAINTLRLVTVTDVRTGEIVTLPPIFRIGANGSKVDNTSKGGLFVPFDVTTGILGKTGYLKPEYGLTARSHPDTNIKFEGLKLPMIKECVDEAIRFHRLLGLHSIGWDIAIGPDGPVFIEGNDNWEINGHQDADHGLMKEFKGLFMGK